MQPPVQPPEILPSCSGVVLAGGRSRRMGRDKALLRVDGRRLVDRAVAALQSLTPDVVVACGERPLDGLDVPQVEDRPGGVGPLGGLIAALRAVDGDVAYVLAVDVHEPDLVLLRALLDRWAGEAAVVPASAGHLQPLHAVWATSAADGVAALVTTGVRSVTGAADRLGAVLLDDAETADLASHDRWAWNINRPEDLPGPVLSADVEAGRPQGP